ncbi:MAG: hypothetical protein WCJ03_03130 [Bacteroidales bacterium]
MKKLLLLAFAIVLIIVVLMINEENQKVKPISSTPVSVPAKAEDVHVKNSPLIVPEPASTKTSSSTYTPPVKTENYWNVTHYTDEFGEETKQKVIRSVDYYGKFSNSATQDSRLRVIFFIEGETSMSIKLFEYDNTNPVKHCTEDGYRMKVRNSTGEDLVIRGENYSDRINFGRRDTKKFTSLLKKNSILKIYIAEISQYSRSSYQVTINPSGFKEALIEYKSKEK